jgi:hypothetical protein
LHRNNRLSHFYRESSLAVPMTRMSVIMRHRTFDARRNAGSTVEIGARTFTLA